MSVAEMERGLRGCGVYLGGHWQRSHAIEAAGEELAKLRICSQR